MPLWIITGSPDSRLTVTNIRDSEKKSFSVLRKLGRFPNLWRIVVTLIPPHWHFSTTDSRLEWGGILEKTNDLTLPKPPSSHYEKGALRFIGYF